ncbi:MAG: inositol monophosphatase family protein [Candidatus Micrarchaeota archaeon]
MDERHRKAVIRAVQEAGEHLGRGDKRNGVEKRSREIMLRRLREAEPVLSMWGEGGDERSFTICPLDSPINLSRGIAPYGTMAALIEGGETVFGALYLPGEGLYTAEKGRGARLDGRKVGGPAMTDSSRALICCDCSGYDQDLQPISGAAVDALSRRARIWRNYGSPAAEYAWLATGRVDAVVVPFPESAHAAGYLLMEEAGATVTDGRGRPFSLGSGSLVAAGAALHEELIGMLRRALP